MSDAPMPIASASELLADVQTRPVWDGASISPVEADYPRVHFDWHEGHGVRLPVLRRRGILERLPGNVRIRIRTRDDEL